VSRTRTSGENIECPHCSTRIPFTHDWIEYKAIGDNVTVCGTCPTCHRDFFLFECPHCNACNFWNNVLEVDGPIINCRSCNRRFSLWAACE
jgi:uncharacterized Zn finger protein